MAVNSDSRSAGLHVELEAVLAIKNDEIIRLDLAELSFKVAEQYVERLRRIVLRLSACDFDLLSNNLFIQCNQFISEVRDLFAQMRSFAPFRSNRAPQNERDEIVQHCANLLNSASDR